MPSSSIAAAGQDRRTYDSRHGTVRQSGQTDLEGGEDGHTQPADRVRPVWGYPEDERLQWEETTC